MRKAIVIFAVLVFAATWTAALVLVQHERASAHVLPAAEKTTPVDPRFRYDVEPGPKLRTFNLSRDVTLNRDDSVARIVFNFADAENHHYVDITPKSIEIVVVQEGIGRVLETVEGLSLPVGKPLNVLVKRRELTIRVVVDDVVLAEAYDETFHTGKVGTATIADGAAFGEAHVQSVAEIYFADDFMRSEKEKGLWTELRGDWSTVALDNPSMSANAFQYFAKGEGEAAAVAGYTFWDDYSFDVAVKPQKHAPFGLYFYYRDENNYFRFDWHPEESDTPGSGKKELVRMWHGHKQVVAQQSGGFQINQWYALRCQVSGRRVQTFIDGNPVFDYRDDRLSSGMVGLYAAADSRAFFDDVFVRSHRCFEDRFTNGSRTAWSTMGGTWRRVPIGNGHSRHEDADSPVSPGGVLTVRSPSGESRAAVGSAFWSNYSLETEMHPDTRGRAGVLVCYQDETRYYQVACERDSPTRETWTLERVLDDQHKIIDEKTVDVPNGSRKLRATIRDGYILVTVNGDKVLQGFDTTLISGRAGFFAADVTQVSFGPLKVDWPLEPPPLLTLNEIFEHEKSMSVWSSVESDWRQTPDSLWLNKGNFPGDASIECDIVRVDDKNAELGLLLSTDGDTPKDGYLLKLVVDDQGQRGLDLLRRGEKVESVSLETGTGVSRLSFRRLGEFLVAYVDRKPRLTWRDRDPLAGDGLGWYARNVKVDTKSVSVSSPNVQKYLFRQAHTDWRVVQGIWEVTNRWTCDPRWTFFSGRSSWKLAAMWNKRHCEGDVTLDFYAGPKMEQTRGNNYEYAANINCTLAADGADLNSGYSFLFGGFDNTKTVLMKGNQIIAEGTWKATGPEPYMEKGRPALVPSAKLSLHHKWFHVKAQKKGNRLRFWIDDALVIDHVDDNPLTGDRVALWTWNNGIMVARVTIAADRLGDNECPDTYKPSHCRCVYDGPAVAGR